MAYVQIRNIGPIREVRVDLNKINVFIGPQSSGKSTIAKIISFCLWLEKDALVRQDTDYINRELFNFQLLGFHKLKNYLNAGFYVKFEGDALCFEYSAEVFSVDRTEGFRNSKAGKVAYIPSERNVVSLPGIASLSFPHNNIRSFLFDWLSIRGKYMKDNMVPLLDLNIRYYYEESAGRDVLVLEDGKEITLEEASSGLQSVAPLYVYLDYLTGWIYEHEEDISFEKKQRSERVIRKELIHTLPSASRGGHETIAKAINDEEVVNSLNRILMNIRTLKADGRLADDSDLSKILELEANITRPHFSNIIIEEPEQNLFPQTQARLIYDLLRMENAHGGRDNLILTTHSPYILYALNNCMLGWLVRDKIPAEDIRFETIRKSWVNPADVAVWEIRDGEFSSQTGNERLTIQDRRGLIRSNYFDRIMKNVMADFSSLLNHYEPDEQAL